MTNPDFNLAEILRSLTNAGLPDVLDEEVVEHTDPVESGPGEPTPINDVWGDDPIEFDIGKPVESGEDVPIEPDPNADPEDGVVTIDPVESTPTDDVHIEPDPNADPEDGVVTIDPVEDVYIEPEPIADPEDGEVSIDPVEDPNFEGGGYQVV